jgi:hypothetical protein
VFQLAPIPIVALAGRRRVAVASMTVGPSRGNVPPSLGGFRPEGDETG